MRHVQMRHFANSKNILQKSILGGLNMENVIYMILIKHLRRMNIGLTERIRWKTKIIQPIKNGIKRI